MPQSSNNQYQSFTATLLESMPPWSRAVLFTVLSVALSLSILSSALNINVGSYLDRYVDIQLKRQEAVTNEAADRIIAAVQLKVAEVEERMEAAIERGQAANRDHDAKLDHLDNRVRGVESSVAKNRHQLTLIDDRTLAMKAWACAKDPDTLGDAFCVEVAQ